MDHSPTKALKKYQYRRITPLLIVVAEPAEKVTSMEKRHPSTPSINSGQASSPGLCPGQAGQVEHGAIPLEVGGMPLVQ
jgi:hypothetical protein